jgi:hypothetical protein
MKGSLDIGFGENQTLRMSQVVGRDGRYACNSVANRNKTLHAASGRTFGASREMSVVTVDPFLVMKGPPRGSCQEVNNNIM